MKAGPATGCSQQKKKLKKTRGNKEDEKKTQNFAKKKKKINKKGQHFISLKIQILFALRRNETNDLDEIL